MNYVIKILLSGVIAFVLSKILTGVHIDNIGIAVLFALLLAALNAIVRPILVILTLPATILTLGLFIFVINAIVVLLADKMVDGIKIDSFWWAMIFSIILSIFDTAVQKTLIDNNKN